MIPVKLTLHNFMPYREAQISFEGIHVACLSGDNGAGKSALLDGLTWALWGKARVRRDDELITLGQREMEVDFTFDLASSLYRVIRKRKAGKRGSSLLDFQIEDEGEWRSLAESTIKDTQEKIDRTLRLDYDTFVNSAFLRQGRADEFTVKTAAERKRVLGEILGLDIWAGYEDRVKLKSRAVDESVRALDLRLEEIEVELGRRPEYEAQVEEARAEVDELGEVLQQAQEAYQEVETARAELRQVRAELAQLAERAKQTQQELETLEQERTERTNRLAEYQALLAQAAEVEAGHTAYQEALELERELGAKLTAQAELNEQRAAIEAQIAEARHELQTQHELALQRVKELEGRLPEPEVSERHNALQVQIEYLDQLRQSKEAAQADLGRLAEERAAVQAHNLALKPEMDELKERIETLEQAEADCPLCGQPLEDSERLRLVEQLQAEGKQRGDTYRSNQARLESIAEEAAGLETQIKESEPELENIGSFEVELTTLVERLRVAEEVSKAILPHRREAEKLGQKLAEEKYASKERKALTKVLTKASKLGYEPEAHQAARQTVEEGQIFAQRKTQLDAAATGQEQERAALAQLERTTRLLAERTEADRARQVEYSKSADELVRRLEKAEQVEQELAAIVQAYSCLFIAPRPYCMLRETSTSSVHRRFVSSSNCLTYRRSCRAQTFQSTCRKSSPCT